MKKINNTFLDRDNLVAEYLLDGNANDTAGTNNGTATNVTWVNGERGYAEEVGSFNGTSSYISGIGNQIPSGVQSYYSGWVNPASLSGGDTFSTTNPKNILSGSDGTFVNFIRFLGTRCSVGVRSGGAYYEARSEQIFTENEPQFLEVLITPSAKVKIWRNGTLLTNDTDNTFPATWENYTNYNFGRQNNSSPTRYYNGELGLFRRDTGIIDHNKPLYQEGLRQFGPTQTTTTIPVSGLVASYDYDDITLDTSGNGNDGTATSVITQKVGQQNVGVYNGSSSYLTTNHSSISTVNNFTESFSYKYNGGALTYFKAFRGDLSGGSYSGFHFYHAGAEIWFRKATSTTTLQDTKFSDTILNDGNFHLVTVTQSSTGGVEVFIDGVSVKTEPTFTANMVAVKNISVIGCNYDDGVTNNFSNVSVGLNRMYDRVLTQAEIDTLNHEAKTKLSFPNYSLRNLEVGKVLEISKPQSGGIYYDQTGNGNNGTPTSVADSTVGLNNVMTFNGTSSNLSFATDLYASTDLGIAFNYSPVSLSGGVQYLTSSTGNLGNLVGMYFNAGTINFFVRFSGGYSTITYTGGATVGKTYRVILQRTSSGLKMYVDGGLVASNATTGVLFSDTFAGLRLGATGDNMNHSNIEVSKYETFVRTLSDTEIQQDYYATKLV